MAFKGFQEKIFKGCPPSPSVDPIVDRSGNLINHLQAPSKSRGGYLLFFLPRVPPLESSRHLFLSVLSQCSAGETTVATLTGCNERARLLIELAAVPGPIGSPVPPGFGDDFPVGLAVGTAPAGLTSN
eukprot:1740042-Pyramimonas_sp.AAC.1